MKSSRRANMESTAPRFQSIMERSPWVYTLFEDPDHVTAAEFIAAATILRNARIACEHKHANNTFVDLCAVFEHFRAHILHNKEHPQADDSAFCIVIPSKNWRSEGLIRIFSERGRFMFRRTVEAANKGLQTCLFDQC